MTSGMNLTMRTDITTTATPYTAGDGIGGLIQLFPGSGLAGFGTINDISIVDTTNQKSALTLLFFSLLPTGGTYTDNAPFVFGSGDFAKLCDGGVVGIAAADYITINSTGIADVACQAGVRWPNVADGSAPIIYMAVIAGGTPTYGANATSLLISVKVVAGHTP